MSGPDVSVALTQGRAGEEDSALVMCHHGTAEGHTSEASRAVPLPPGAVRADAAEAEREAARGAQRLLADMAEALRERYLRTQPPDRRLDM